MATLANIHDISNIVQLAVAPVFLLTGIAAFLGVLSNRLGRITDRARVLDRRLIQLKQQDSQLENQLSQQEQNTAILNTELSSLWLRITIINKAIRLCTSSALLICIVVITLFVADFSDWDLSGLIALLFVSAMISLIIGLVYFLREVSRATASMQLGMAFVGEDIENDNG